MTAARMLFAVGALTLLVGCGGGTNDANGSAVRDALPATGAPNEEVDACRLVTTAEAARALEEHSPENAAYTVTATTNDDGTCTYTWTSTGSGGEFTVHEFPSSRYVAQPGVEPRSIDGIGDEAWEEIGTYYARLGDRIVAVANVQEGEGADEALLRIAAGHLGP